MPALATVGLVGRVAELKRLWAALERTLRRGMTMARIVESAIVLMAEMLRALRLGRQWPEGQCP